jgi:hypothetical protein
MGMTTDAPPPAIPVNFLEDALTETTIAVGDRAEDVCAGHLLGLGFWPFFGANCASRFFCSLSE